MCHMAENTSIGGEGGVQVKACGQIPFLFKILHKI